MTATWTSGTFLDFILAHYTKDEVEEPDLKKLTSLLRHKYHNSLADAVAELGNPDGIKAAFVGFQCFLYGHVA